MEQHKFLRIYTGITKNILLSIVLFTIGTVASENCRMSTEIWVYRVREDSYGRCLSCISFTIKRRTISKYYCQISGGIDEINIFETLFDKYRNSYDRPEGISLKIESHSSKIVSLIPLANSDSWTWNELIKIDLSLNHISDLQPYSLQWCPQLQELHLSDNFLTEIKKDNFLPLVDLQKLNLSRNIITDVSADSFVTQVNLFVIDLSYNKISKLSADVFRKQYHLEHILLNNNQLVTFDVLFKSITSSFLPSVDLSYNNIETIQFNGEFLSVNISKNKLTHFSINLTSSMISLTLSHNDITEISPYSFLNANGMKELDLSYNLLSTIRTNSFTNLKLLEKIDISHNILFQNCYGDTDNWVSFFLHFENLKNVSLNGNAWDCSDLKDILLSLKSRSVRILPGHEYAKSNILGISCSDLVSNQSLVSSDTHRNIMEHILKEVGRYTNYSFLQKNVSNLLSKINQIENFSLKNLTNQFGIMEEKLNNLHLKKDLDKIVKNNETSKDLIGDINNIIDKKILNLRQEFRDDKINNMHKNNTENITPNVQADTLLQDIRDGLNAKSGEIINNILLFILLCCFLYFLYRYYKNVNNPIRDEINLV